MRRYMPYHNMANGKKKVLGQNVWAWNKINSYPEKELRRWKKKVLCLYNSIKKKKSLYRVK